MACCSSLCQLILIHRVEVRLNKIHSGTFMARDVRNLYGTEGPKQCYTGSQSTLFWPACDFIWNAGFNWHQMPVDAPLFEHGRWSNTNIPVCRWLTRQLPNAISRPGFNASSSSGNVFFGNTTFNSSAGVTFGGSALNKSFDLRPPPFGGKRNRNKWRRCSKLSTRSPAQLTECFHCQRLFQWYQKEHASISWRTCAPFDLVRTMLFLWNGPQGSINPLKKLKKVKVAAMRAIAKRAFILAPCSL